MKDKIIYILLGAFILLGVFLRLNNLGGVPPQPTVDEVSLGYNAFSLIKTGADEFGEKYPILLRAYDDWRPALYVYLVMPFIMFMGLTVEAVRMPSVVLSIATVIGVYFLIKELTIGSKSISIGKTKIDVAVVATILFAVSPWHIYISRLGHEVNASYAFLIFGILFFLKFVNKEKPKIYNIILSSVFFALSFDSYQSTKLAVPLIVITLSGLYFKKLIANRVKVLIAFIIGVVLVAPIILTSFSDNALIRFKATNLMEHSVNYFDQVAERYAYDYETENKLGMLFDNRRVGGILLMSHAYLSHFDPVWLFLNEGGEQFKAPQIGLLFLFELPFIIAGLIYFASSGISGRNRFFIIAWALIAVIPAAITTGYAHPMRVFNILPLPQLFTALGVIYMLSKMRDSMQRLAGLSIVIVAILISSAWFYHSYFTLVPREISFHFQYGIINSLKYAFDIDQDYDRVFVSNQSKLFESYMFYLFAKGYDPIEYQKIGGTVSGGFAEEHEIGKYKFGKIDQDFEGKTLYIINPEEKTKNMNVIKSINYPDGKPAYLIADVNNEK